MEQNNTHTGLPLLFLGWFFNGVSMLDRNTVSFVLGTIATLLAIIHYVVKINNDSKKN